MKIKRYKSSFNLPTMSEICFFFLVYEDRFTFKYTLAIYTPGTSLVSLPCAVVLLLLAKCQNPPTESTAVPVLPLNLRTGDQVLTEFVGPEVCLILLLSSDSEAVLQGGS